MPARWRQRLKQRFWQPDSFRAALHRMATDPGEAARGLPRALIDRLDPDDPLDARIVIGQHLDTLGLEIIGTRSLSEITERVLDVVTDARLPKLEPETTRLIGDVLAVTAPIREAAQVIGDRVQRHSIELTRALSAFERRVAALDRAGVDLARTQFDADFGRNFEYYTGFVFEVQSADLGAPSPVAGGGRYDGLLQVVGAPRPVPAVGCAVHTERLLSCIARSRG
jgi:ATP phosphoribosyltransferase regulatory subunit